MKRNLFLLFLFASTVGAETVSIQFRVGHFRPSSHLFRNIYHQGGIEYEGELNYEYVPGNSLWLNASSFEREGRTPDDQETKIQLRPLSGGIKQFIPFNSWITLYLGAGSSCTFMKVKRKITVFR